MGCLSNCGIEAAVEFRQSFALRKPLIWPNVSPGPQCSQVTCANHRVRLFICLTNVGDCADSRNRNVGKNLATSRAALARTKLDVATKLRAAIILTWLVLLYTTVSLALSSLSTRRLKLQQHQTMWPVHRLTHVLSVN